MDFRKLFCCLAMALICFVSKGQFYLYGDDPGRLKWSEINTDNYRIVYPRGLDSLARKYAISLEKYRDAVGASAGYPPNASYRKRMPVILHSYSNSANGMVVWTPRRMELYTTQDPYNPNAFPWITELTIHESRHVAQMQYANAHGNGEGSFRPLNILTGQLWAGALAALYGNPAFFEGDAVVAETALSASGRGRNAYFLEYYRAAFDSGDFRDWYKWNYGSIKDYAPSYYSVGYMTVAGIRTLYDDPLFTGRFYHNILRNKLFPFPLFNMQRTVEQASGKKFGDTFREIECFFQENWEKEAAARGPEMESHPVTTAPRRFRQYYGTVSAGGRILSIMKGLDSAAYLVDISSGGKKIMSFSQTTSGLQWSSTLGKVFWSESIPDARWSLAGKSEIRFLIPGNGRTGTLISEGRYFNPAPFPTDGRIAVTSYPYSGGSDVLVLNGWTGEVMETLHAPDSLQVVESAWYEDEIIVSGVSEAGFGLYNASNGFGTLLEPRSVKIKQLRGISGSGITFVCDRDGTDELYSFNLEDSSLEQLSSVRYAASDFVFEDDSLYYSMLTHDARGIYRTALENLPRKKVNWNDIFRYSIADSLSAQESRIAPATNGDVSVSAPRKYVKALNLIRIHSWAPIYFDYESIKSLSGDFSSYGISPGAIAFFQNDLGTASGFAGYSVKRDNTGEWRHMGHLDFTYSGLLPVFEGRVDFNKWDSSAYSVKNMKLKHSQIMGLSSRTVSKPGLSAKMSVYIPLSVSRGGWTNGFIPQLDYDFSNSTFCTWTANYSVPEYIKLPPSVFTGADEGKMLDLQRICFSIRAYRIRDRYRSGIYPKLGIGMEIGACTRIGLADYYSPNLYLYSYGYLPGIVPEHGIRLSLTAQKHLKESFMNENYISCVPRGFAKLPPQSSFITRAGAQVKFTFDYGMAIAPVDWSFLCPAAYIRNFILKPHFDAAFYRWSDGTDFLYSAGADFSAALGNFLWLPFDSELGVTFSYNGGPSFNDFKNSTNINRYYIGAIFNISFK